MPLECVYEFNVQMCIDMPTFSQVISCPLTIAFARCTLYLIQFIQLYALCRLGIIMLNMDRITQCTAVDETKLKLYTSYCIVVYN